MTAQVIKLRDLVKDARPWSAAEIEALIPTAMERKNEVVETLKSLGENAAKTKWAYERAAAQARAHAWVHFRDEPARTAKEEREAWAFLNWRDPDTQMDLYEYGLAKDLAANAYRDQGKVLESADTDLKVLQTLHVSARAVG